MKIKDIGKVLYILKQIQDVQSKYQDIKWEDVFSDGQIQSKLWLLENIKELDLGIVFVLGGWVGLLPRLMFDLELKIEKIRSIDTDEYSNKIADIINNIELSDNWKFKAITDDINNINLQKYSWSVWSKKNNRMSYPITDIPNTIINTSCEHMSDKWFNKISYDTLVILQSNNFLDGEGHINCIHSLEQMKSKYQLTNVIYSGELKLNKYTRYMLIGYK